MRRVLQSKPIQVALIGASVLFGALALRANDPDILQLARNLTFDSYQRLKPREPTALPVRIIDIDDDGIRHYGQWPWPRTKLAEIVDRLADLGAAAIAFDMVFSEPDRSNPSEIARRMLQDQPDLEPGIRDRLRSLPDSDEVLARSAAQLPSVVGFFATASVNSVRPRQTAGFAFAGNDAKPALLRMNGAIVPLPILQNAASGIGSVSLSGDRQDDVIRRVPLVITDGDAVYPALSIEALRIATGTSTFVLKSVGASGEISGGKAGMVSIKIADLVVPTTAAGEIQMYYRRDQPSDYISVSRLLSGNAQDLAPLVQGHIVLIGTSAVGLSDLRLNALGQTVPGVSLHAQIIEQILSQDFLRRPDWADGAEMTMTTIVTLLVMAIMPFSNALFSAAFGAVCAAIVAAVSWMAFARYGILIEPLLAMLTGGVLYILAITLVFAIAERERRFVRNAFQHYLAPSLLKKLEASPEQLILGGEMRNVTVLFMDVRGFTGISEKLSPNDLVSFLNQLFSPLTDIIQKQEGAIDKYIGDSIMAFWNAPLEVEDHARKACRAALQAVEAVERLDHDDVFGFRQRSLDIPKIRIGIGLGTGDACVGNMGSADRFNYSVVGDTVNIAARTQSEAKAIGWPILVSETTASAAPGMAFLSVGDIMLKGKSQSIGIYALVGEENYARSPEFAQLKENHEQLAAALAINRRGEINDALERCMAHAPDRLKPLYHCLRRNILGGYSANQSL
ncbi:CHASE2 domain-containing protein [Pseudaminobacter sp. NGMCC 1.201702]|uniref:CHASE2 domain-containing protein n=1 Tax=Pseudaminobacter sp. NGMCC 1.201702 TaxID=3391825 RepID=UPI0039F0C678